MSEAPDGMRYSPDRVEVREGEQVRFVVRNSGTLSHEFFIGGADENKRARRDDGRHAGHEARRSEREDGRAGSDRRACSGNSRTRASSSSPVSIPGHYEAGMHALTC